MLETNKFDISFLFSTTIIHLLYGFYVICAMRLLVQLSAI